ncbi:MAG TPA: hypothetical protein PK358_07815 [Spirochaetota bacterium]|nr:hypothetical protein [Spirochaetota bacterium]HPJ34726.1 hypothetical protein [Spirochaetota bacterium]
MRDAQNINNTARNKKYVDKIRESLINKKPDDDSNREEIEFLLKRL